MTTLPATVQERVSLPSPNRAGAADAASTITSSDVLAMLRRRVVLIVTLFLFLGAASVGMFLMMWTKFPKYKAEAFIECISNVPDDQYKVGGAQRLRQDELERFVLTQAHGIKHPVILSVSLGLTEVKGTGWYKAIDKDWMLELIDDLEAGPVRGTNLLRVAMACREKTDPKTIVNSIVLTWFNEVKRAAGDQFAEPLALAQTELEALNRDILEKYAQQAAIAARLPAGANTAGRMNITAQQVLMYGEQVAMLDLELSQLDQYVKLYREGVGVTAEDRQIIELHPLVQPLSQQLFFMEQALAGYSPTFGANHTEVKRLRASIDAANETLEKTRDRLYLERQDNVREAAETAMLNTQSALFQAQENLQKSEAALQDQDRELFKFGNLDDQIEQDLITRGELQGYEKQLRRLKDQKSAIKIRVVQSAIDPLKRSFPSPFLLPVFIIFALGMSIGTALAVEMLDTSVRTTQDITRYLDLPLLGAVPDVDDEELPIEQVETTVRDAPRSMVAEAFRRIRTNLQFSAPAARQRALVVTSAQPDDGKTTVAINLAMVIAQGGRRVLLVDANFRRPGLAKIFPNVGGAGLSNVLVGDGSLSQHAKPSGFPLVDLLGSGPLPPNPAELLGGETFNAFLEDAISRYDQVLIDTPPILLASDALVACTATDGVVLVVRAKENSRGLVRRAVSLLSGVNAHVFGAVLNAAQVTRGGYYREQLRSHYDYQMEADLATGTSQAALPPATGKADDAGEETS